MTLKIDAKFEEKLFQEWQEFGETWPEPLQVSKTCIFIWFYCAKYLMFDLKKYGGVIFHNTEGWCKIWRKTDLWFGKWHEEYGKFSPEQLKVSKLAYWWDPLIQSRKSMSFWNHIMKNFQLKHDQCDIIIFLKTFSLESSK